MLILSLEHTFEQEIEPVWVEPGARATRGTKYAIAPGRDMSKRYEEPADVEAPEGAIEAFWWRGKRYYVRQVLCRWREASGWWEPMGDAPQPWARGDAREIWRVDAQPETNGLPPGTYELCHDLRSGTWSLFRVWD